uniref:CARD domain-containing protein n=1 Tax=Esox lucius TaxID=8010 RepID=A0A6Q2YJT2_ESOLU
MAKEFMCEKKIFLIEALSGNASFILQYTQTEKLLTDREYRNIHGLVQSQNQERIVIDLIDLLSQKGEDFCCGFLDLLKSPEIVKTMPKLRDMDWDTRSLAPSSTQTNSTLANVPSGGKCNVPPGMIDCQEFKGKIIGHLLSEEHTCPQGHPLERVNPCGRSVTCEKCPMTYISSSVKNIFRGNLSIQSDVDSLIREFHVEDRVIRKVLWEDLKSVKEVEDALVALPPVTITVLSGNVLSIAALTQDVATQKSAAHIAWTEGV